MYVGDVIWEGIWSSEVLTGDEQALLTLKFVPKLFSITPEADKSVPEEVISPQMANTRPFGHAKALRPSPFVALDADSGRKRLSTVPTATLTPNLGGLEAPSAAQTRKAQASGCSRGTPTAKRPHDHHHIPSAGLKSTKGWPKRPATALRAPKPHANRRYSSAKTPSPQGRSPQANTKHRPTVL